MVETVTRTETPIGQIDLHSFTLERERYSYYIAYVDYPIPGITYANPVGALEGHLRQALDSHNATLVTKRDMLSGSAIGIEFTAVVFSGSEFVTSSAVFGRVYLVGARLYQIIVVAPTNAEGANSRKFLASFQWINPAGKLEINTN
jgi:hypothetical protein